MLTCTLDWPNTSAPVTNWKNLINAGIGHRVAADGYAGTVNHQVFTFITMGAIVGVEGSRY